MAITKLMCIHEAVGPDPSNHLYSALQYIANPEKTRNGYFVGSANVMPDADSAYKTMIFTKNRFEKSDMRQGYHYIISFPPAEHVSPEIAYKIIGEFVERYIGEKYECLYSVHEDREHMHGHIIFNSVNRVDGKKYRYNKGDWRKYIQPITNELCQKYGLSTIAFEGYSEEDIVVTGSGSNLRYSDWKQKKHGYRTWLDYAKADIDEAIYHCNTWETLIDYLSNRGWIIRDQKQSGGYLTHFTMQAEGMEKPLRPDRIGNEYSRDGICARMKLQKEYSSDLTSVSSGSSISPRVVNFNWNAAYKGNTWQNIPSSNGEWQIISSGSGSISPYRKKWLSMMYRTGKMVKQPAASVPINFRQQSMMLQKMQTDLRFIYTYNISSSKDALALRDKLKNDYKNINTRLHHLYSMRYGTMDMTVFWIESLKLQGKAIPAEFIPQEKNIEKQKLAKEILSSFPARQLGPDFGPSYEKICSIIHRKFESDDFRTLNENDFLEYLSTTDPEEIREKMEKLYNTSHARNLKKVSQELLNQRTGNETISEIKQKIIMSNAFNKSEKNVLLNYQDIELLYEQLDEYVIAPAHNLTSLDYIDNLREFFPNELQKQISTAIATGLMNPDDLESFAVCFKSAEKELIKQKKEVEAEWQILSDIIENHYKKIPKDILQTSEKGQIK